MNEQRPIAQPSAVPTIKPAAPAARGQMESMALSDEPTTRPAISSAPQPPTASKIKLGNDVQHIDSKLSRVPVVTHTGACRVKTFIGKVSTQGMEYMDHTINIWLDQHPEIEVKHVVSTFGKLDGKVEHAIITSVWY
jgi:hypothetical protein